MSLSKVVRTTVLDEGVRSRGEDTSRELHRKGPKRISAETDGEAARWFDAAVGCWGKGVAYASELGVMESFLSEMRAGKRGIALRHLLPLLGHTEAVLAFVAPLLESIGYVARPVRGLTEAELALIVLRGLNDGSAVTRRLIENLAAPHGHEPAEVQLVLHGEGSDE